MVTLTDDTSSGDVDVVSWPLNAAQVRELVWRNDNTRVYYKFLTVWVVWSGELTSAGHRTLFTGLVPSAANVVGAAAHLLGHVEGQLAVTCSVVGVEVPVTVALPHVFMK